MATVSPLRVRLDDPKHSSSPRLTRRSLRRVLRHIDPWRVSRSLRCPVLYCRVRHPITAAPHLPDLASVVLHRRRPPVAATSATSSLGPTTTAPRARAGSAPSSRPVPSPRAVSFPDLGAHSRSCASRPLTQCAALMTPPTPTQAGTSSLSSEHTLMRSTRNGYNLRMVHDLHDYLVSIGWTEQVQRVTAARSLV